MTHRFPYEWKMATGYPEKAHNRRVFSTFSCGGGSSMGYKLAGYRLVGANDIDPQMKKVYETNHHPENYFLCPVKDLLKKTEWPEEFEDLDILDGSPPCSTFSLSGSREKAWGKEKHFREGQAKQILDDLFFDFIKLANLLRPKIIIAENVKGMLVGNAKGYVKEIYGSLDRAGYETQVFLLNAASMGVPQRRERVFFISRRKDLTLPKVNLSFKESPVSFKEVDDGNTPVQNKITPCDLTYWKMCKPGKSIATVHPKGNRFNSIKLAFEEVPNTIASGSCLYHPRYERALNDRELAKIGTFPLDYNYLDVNPQYLIGMSVPPVMMAQVASQVYEQCFASTN